MIGLYQMLLNSSNACPHTRSRVLNSLPQMPLPASGVMDWRLEVRVRADRAQSVALRRARSLGARLDIRHGIDGRRRSRDVSSRPALCSG